MQSQINTDALVELSDFSSALLRADSERSTSRYSDEPESRGIESHRNLSSAIAGIRDEGSALSVPKKKVRKMPTRSSVTEFANRARESVMQQEKMKTSTASVSPGIINSQTAANNLTNHTTTQVQDAPRKSAMNKPSSVTGRSRQQMVLLLTISILVGIAFFIFQLFSQSEDLQKSIGFQTNKTEVVSDAETLALENNPQYAKLQEDLEEMKQVLRSIKSNFDEIDSVNMQAEMEEVVLDVNTIKGNMLETQRELNQIKASLDTETAGTGDQLPGSETLSTVSQVDQVQKATVTAENITAGKMIAEKVEAKKIVSVKATSGTATRTRNWVATLASFGSHALAQKASNELEMGGLIVNIEQATVKGNTVYRIGRAGFPTHKDAMAFIASSESTTSMKGGWVYLKK